MNLESIKSLLTSIAIVFIGIVQLQHNREIAYLTQKIRELEEK